MARDVNIEYTETAKSTLSDIAYYLQKVDVKPLPVIEKIINEFEAKVSTFPNGCQIVPELLKIGCDKYRECNTSNGYRVIYSTEQSLITTHVILSQKQDIQQTLFKRLIEI
ncbi:plasmid stabilization protein [Brenneria roseae subsp. roseae]|uniref:type II toxin-antitoxin system RelE/ParE family toxin n=1 Tax=Brenneria roseae TaxID=1509241 RepID=UPI000D61129B|nr:type II toxin-antitoxin system RelE/ParE family toxin [Brenneria roseae]PWC18313.1 plasmid stabilization protein [Brenneria roseae subsp. roseae]